VTKSGSNTLHGSGFEFFRNTALNANDFFRNRYCAQPGVNCGTSVKPQLNQNQFGGVIGGAIIKDKLFFFGSYQGTRQKNGLASQGLQTVNIPLIPGDRSNKAALRAALGQAWAGKAGALGGVAIKADGSNISDVALNILQLKLNDGSYYMPGATSASAVGGNLLQNGVAYTKPAWFNENQVLGNIDYLLNTKHTIASRYYYQPQTQHNAQYDRKTRAVLSAVPFAFFGGMPTSMRRHPADAAESIGRPPQRVCLFDPRHAASTGPSTHWKVFAARRPVRRVTRPR